MGSSAPTINKTRLSKIFTMQVRENPEKPGRSIMDVWDIRRPLLKGFENNYSYIVTLREKGNIAGNHYHEKKQELIYPIMGTFTVALENIESKEREEILLETAKHQVVYFPTRIAHVIRAETEKAIFLVVTTSTEAEVIPYKVL
jgi:quercetin dioxygenase-like cupin family protein